MKTWTKLLPFFVVEWWAKKYCQMYTTIGFTIVSPYKDVRLILTVEEINERDTQLTNE